MLAVTETSAAPHSTCSSFTNINGGDVSNSNSTIDLRMDMLPDDILRRITGYYCWQYGVLTGHVCRSWRRNILSITNGNNTNKGSIHDWDSLVETFASNGHVRLLQWLFEIAHDYHKNSANKSPAWDLVVAHDGSLIASVAAIGGHVDIIRKCWEYGVFNFTTAMLNAASAGHIEIVRLCKEQYGEDDVNRAMIRAACGGHIHIVRLCREKYGAKGIDQTMVHAAKNGHIDIVRLCKETYGATDIDEAMVCAACGGHMDIVQLCKEKYGATDVNPAMIEAARNGHMDIVRLCEEEYGATAVYSAMVCAQLHHHMAIVRLFKRKYGVTDLGPKQYET